MNFGNAAAVVHRAVALTAEYFEVYRHGSKVPRRNDYMYIRTCIVVVVVHMWGRLIVVQVVRYSAFKIA